MLGIRGNWTYICQGIQCDTKRAASGVKNNRAISIISGRDPLVIKDISGREPIGIKYISGPFIW